MRLHWICWAVFTENQGRVFKMSKQLIFIFFCTKHFLIALKYFLLKKWIWSKKESVKKPAQEKWTKKLKTKEMLFGSHKSRISILVFFGWATEPINSSSSQLCSWHLKPRALHWRDWCYQLHIITYPVTLVTTLCLEHSAWEFPWA